MSEFLLLELCGGGGGGGPVRCPQFPIIPDEGYKWRKEHGHGEGVVARMDALLLGSHASFTNMSTLSDLWFPPPFLPEWHRSASFKPSSIIHPATLRPAAHDWWTKEKRQTDEQGRWCRLRSRDGERRKSKLFTLKCFVTPLSVCVTFAVKPCRVGSYWWQHKQEVLGFVQDFFSLEVWG